ncbi:ABC transporter ATP-binding protein, partial [Escherichia coli]|nr:ABC transporter ATP-binding protein [Escherichia coli]
FQNYALFPHLSISENVGYGLAARGVDKATRNKEAQRLLDMVQLGPFGERLPRQLSGGKQQRVALARALAIKPSILLLDEPFAALDKNLRLDMQIEVKRLQRMAGTTTLIVTHDQEEALSMADRVAVLSHGHLEQFGT